MPLPDFVVDAGCMMMFLPALVLLAACATVPKVSAERVAALKEVEASAVANCKRLGKKVGVSTQPGEDGIKQARQEARMRAAADGATHIVPDDDEVTPDVTTSSVRAYDCGE